MHVAVFVFDLLLLDGESMLKRPLRERRERLADALPVGESAAIAVAVGAQWHYGRRGAPRGGATGVGDGPTG